MEPRPKDTNQLAKLVVDIATGEATDETETDKPVTKKPSRKRKSAGKGKGPVSGSGSR